MASFNPYAGGPTAIGGSGVQVAFNPYGGGAVVPGEPSEEALSFNPLGFLRNLAGDVGQLATGITGLIQAGGEDLVKGIREGISLGAYEDNQGYKTAAIAKALPDALLNDYTNRYSGATNIARGLYEDPLAYVLDVFMVGGAAKVAAKAGRIGVLSKLPPVVPEGTAERILGATRASEAGAYQPVSRAVNIEGGLVNHRMTLAGVQEFDVSQNPATRALQDLLLRVGSRAPSSPELAALREGLEPGLQMRLDAARELAQRMGIRVLRPGPSRFFSGKKTTRALSELRVNEQQLGQEDREWLAAAFENADNPIDAAHIVRGNAAPSVPFDYSPIRIDVPSDDLVPIDTTISVNDLRILKPQAAPDDAFISNIYSPHAKPDSKSYTVIVDSINDIPRVARETAAKLGLTDVRIKNYFPDETSEVYDAFHVVGRTPDGRNIDVSVATRQMADAQETFSFLHHRSDSVTAAIQQARTEVEALQAAVAAGGADTVALGRAVDELATLQEEAYGVSELMKTSFRDTRALYHGGDLLDHDAQVALSSAAGIFNRITRRWMDSLGGTASRYWHNAYREQRFNQFYGTLTRLRGEFRDILSRTRNSDEAYLDLINTLERESIPEQLIGEILGQYPWRADAVKGAMRLARRVEKQLYDYTIVEGGRGLEFGFPEYDWRAMHELRLDTGSPVPRYFPNYAKKPSELGLVSRGAQGISGTGTTPSIARQWKGRLLREGRVIDDPVEAYGRAAQIAIDHEELIETLNSLVPAVGRRLSPREVIGFKSGQYGGEVLVPVGKVKQQLSLATEILSDQLDGLARGETWTEATIRSFENLADEAYKEALAGMLSTEVYAFPRSVARKLQQEIKLQTGFNMRIYWDGPMALWKSTVLSLSPRWWVYNLFGNQVFMGLENPGALRLSLKQFDKKTASVTREVLGHWEEMSERGFFRESAAYGSVIPEEATGLLGAARAVRDSYVGRKVSRASTWSRNMQTHVEQAARRGTLVNELQKRTMFDWTQGAHDSYTILERALREGDITPAIMKRAVNGVNKTLGNYTTFSPVQQHIVRRFFVPFWGFYRHAARVILKLPYEHPGKAFLLRQIDEIDRQMMQDGTPEWMRGYVTLAMFGGEDVMARLQNFNPLNQFSGDVRLLGMANPVLKTLIESQLGVDTFTGEPFRLPDDVIETWNGSHYQVKRDGSGNIVGVELLTAPPNPGLVDLVLQNFPQTSLYPSWQRYPKSIELQFLNLLGVPLSQFDVQGTIARNQEAEAAALQTFRNRDLGAGVAGAAPAGGFNPYA